MESQSLYDYSRSTVGMKFAEVLDSIKSLTDTCAEIHKAIMTHRTSEQHIEFGGTLCKRDFDDLKGGDSTLKVWGGGGGLKSMLLLRIILIKV